MKQLIIVLVLVFASISCGQDYPKKSPPGWTVVCDLTRGYYAPKHIKSGHIIIDNFEGNPFKTHRAAIIRAWLQYNYIPRPEEPGPVFDWEECGNE